MKLKYGFRMSPLSEEDGGGFLIEVPELPGCMTDGDTPEEALSKLNDALYPLLQYPMPFPGRL